MSIKSMSSNEVQSLVGDLVVAVVGNSNFFTMDCSCGSSVDGSNDLCTYCSEVFQEPPPQPECPICFESLKFDRFCSVYLACCGNEACMSCVIKELDMTVTKERVSPDDRGFKALVLKQSRIALNSCPFCRAPLICSHGESVYQSLQKRIDASDGQACSLMAGARGVAGDLIEAAKLYVQAAKLSYIVGECYVADLLEKLGNTYPTRGCSVRDTILSSKKVILLEGAKKGCLHCHRHLGHTADDQALAYKHFCFASKHGCRLSSMMLLAGFRGGHITKDEFAQTLRAYQLARDAIMSQERLELVKNYDQYGI